MRAILTFTLCLFTYFSLSAQTVIERPDLRVPSKIAPAYFGPNAFPVPDMLDGRTSDVLKAELYADGFCCTMTDSPSDDLTFDVFAKVTIPLFTSKVNLVLWMPVVEYHRTSPEVNALRRVPSEGYVSGWDSGDAYVSTDIRLLNQQRHGCDMTVRAALKSASGNSWSTARVYDSPGYFFDLSAGRRLYASKNGRTSLRLAVSGGFLCWQTGNGRQNDAVMYGLMAAFATGPLSLDMTYGGYVGWEGDGDCPMTLKTRLSWSFGRIALNLAHQVGFMDWPFHQLRLGLSYNVSVLKN